MALETVDIDRGIGVAAGTKIPWVFHPDILAVFTFDGVAVDTLFQCILPAADTLVHGFVPLMQNVVHVITAHLVFGLYALLGIAEVSRRFC
jgi:hypothetical protein